jgi:hypothetical protein
MFMVPAVVLVSNGTKLLYLTDTNTGNLAQGEFIFSSMIFVASLVTAALIGQIQQKSD